MVDNEKGNVIEHPAPLVEKPKRQIGIGTAVIGGLIIAVIAFVGGTRSGDLLASFSVTGQNAKLSQSLDFSSVQEVYQKLRTEYDGTLDQQKLIDGAKKGLVEAAGDPYTAYFTNTEADQFFSDLDGKFSGIGAELGKKDASLIIMSTLDGSPARKSGLLANDIIAKVNDEEATGWSIDKAVSLIRGQKGTTVKLTIVRNQQEVKDISIVRDDIVNPSVTHEVTADNIGIMRISRFAEDTGALARTAATEFKDKNVKGVILDVRGNGGGYLTAAQDVSSLWLGADKVIVDEKRADKVVETLKANGDAILQGMPTTVLIDGGSASASEIVAGALHDHKAATLLGVKTFGKGSVQRIFKIPGNGQVKITVSKWFTPSGKNISKEGIEPDTKVELNPADTAAGKDAQKDKAIELLKKISAVCYTGHRNIL